MNASRALSVMCLLIAVAGCGQPDGSTAVSIPASIKYKAVVNSNSARLEFGQWVLVFEGVSSSGTNPEYAGKLFNPRAGFQFRRQFDVLWAFENHAVLE